MSIVSTSEHLKEPEEVNDIVIYDGWYVQKGFARIRTYKARKAGHWPILFTLSFKDEMTDRLLAIVAAVDKGVEAQRQYVSDMLDYRGKGYW